MAAQRALINIAKGGLVLGVGGFILDQSLFDVNGGERVVMFDRFRGVLPDVYGEGTHLKMPFIQYPKHFDVKCQPRQISTHTGTKDMQMVSPKPITHLTVTREYNLVLRFASAALDLILLERPWL